VQCHSPAIIFMSLRTDNGFMKYVKQLIPWSRFFPEKLAGPQMVKNFFAFYRTRGFISSFTRGRCLSLILSQINSVHPSPSHFVKIHFVISSHLCLGRPSGLIPQGLSSKTMYAPHLSPIRATCPAHLILLDLVTQIVVFDEAYRS